VALQQGIDAFLYGGGGVRTQVRSSAGTSPVKGMGMS